MNESLLSEQRDIYRQQFISHGDCPDATHNQSKLIQQLRFSRLHAVLNFEQRVTVHDVGCGLCDLYPYLVQRFPNVVYSGTDIVPEMCQLSISKYPKISVFCRDLIVGEVADRYDYLVLSGLFNLPGRVTSADWSCFVRLLLARMYEMCTKGIVFNFLNAGTAEYLHPDMYYENPENIARFFNLNFSRFVYIDQSYPLFEFTTTILKPEFVRRIYTDSALQRYIK